MDNESSQNNKRKPLSSYKPLSRRRFLQVAAGAACAATLPLSGCSDIQTILSNASGIPLAERTITDHAGREVTIPAAGNIQKIFATSALGQFFIITCAPDLLGAVTSAFTEEDLSYLPEVGLENLTALGSLTEGTLNSEGLLLEDIQVVFSISAVGLTQTNISDAENLQAKTGIPVVLIDGSMDKIAEAYRFLGECIGREDRTNELGSYCTDIWNKVTTAVADVTDEERVSYYYAEGLEGLNSEPRGGQHVVAFDAAGGYNIIDGFDEVDMGMMDVSMEQVLAGDPDVIFTRDFETAGGASLVIETTATWAGLRAVSEGKVYCMPEIPVAWVDRPAASNRFLGMQWVANLLYPDRYDVDMIAVTQEFYSLFYQRDITEEQVLQFLGNSYTG